VQVADCDVPWLEALQEIGAAKTFSEELNGFQEDKMTMPVPTWEFLQFRKADKVLTEMMSEVGVSPYSLGRIPPAVLPGEGESLKIKRRKGVYLYLIMTKRCHELYQEVKKHCADLVASGTQHYSFHSSSVSQLGLSLYLKCSIMLVFIVGKAEPDDYKFSVGDVVLVPWNTTTYQRGYITQLQDSDGPLVASVMGIDIEQKKRFPVSKLKRPDEYLMSVGAFLCEKTTVLFVLANGVVLVVKIMNICFCRLKNCAMSCGLIRPMRIH